MFDYQKLKDEFYRLARDAENNVRKDKLKAPKDPFVYEGLHDISLARRDLYSFLATSHFIGKQDFLHALNRLLKNPSKNNGAFDESKYTEAYTNCLRDLIDEHQ